jgi:hypothetical protein
MHTPRAAALLSFAAFTLVNLPTGPRAVVPISLPGIGVPGVIRQPMQLPAYPTSVLPGVVIHVRAPGLVEEKPTRESISEKLRKIADDPIARERIGDVFDNSRGRTPLPPFFGR